MIRSRTTAGRARNGLIALLGALLTLAVAGAEAGAATYTFTNPYARTSTLGSAEAYRDAATKGYNLRLDLAVKRAPNPLGDELDREEFGDAGVYTHSVKARKSAPKFRATVRVLSLLDATTSQGVRLAAGISARGQDSWGGCGQAPIVTTPGTYTFECTATGVTAGNTLTGVVRMLDRFSVYTDPAGRVSATAIVDSITITT
jgi:hypothetical protein